MKAISKNHGAVIALLSICMVFPTTASAEEKPIAFSELLKQCAPSVHPKTMQALIATESAFNPFAIGVVDGLLERQPRNKAEAILTAKSLEEKGYNFSLGLAQINKKNLPKYAESLDSIFDPCKNLAVGGKILDSCYQANKHAGNDQQSLYQAFSCYYSGNPTRGFMKETDGKSYVERVIGNVDSKVPELPVTPVVPEIEPAAIAVATLPASASRITIRDKNSPWVQILPTNQVKDEKSAEGKEAVIAERTQIPPAAQKGLSDRELQRDFVQFVK